MLTQANDATRVLELQSLLEIQDEHLRALITDVEELRAGKWDDRILRELGLKTGDQEEGEPIPMEPALTKRSAPDLREALPEEEEKVVVAKQSSVEHDIHIATRYVELIVQESRKLANEEICEAPPQLLGYPSSPSAEERMDPADVKIEESTVEDVEPAVVPHMEELNAPPVSGYLLEPGVRMDGYAAVELKEAADAQGVAKEPEEHLVEEEVRLLGACTLPSPQREKLSEPAGNSQSEGEAEIAIEAEARAGTESRGAAEVRTSSQIAFDSEAQVELGGIAVEVDELLPTGNIATLESLPANLSGGKRKFSDTDLTDSQRNPKRAREASESTEDQESSSSTARFRRKNKTRTPAEGRAVSKRFPNIICMLHNTISQHRYGNIFRNPVGKSEAPDYRDIVKRPMDLKTIKTRVRNGAISNSLEFQRDVYLMFANAMMYNRPGSELYNMAQQMMLDSEAHINTFRHTEGVYRG